MAAKSVVSRIDLGKVIAKISEPTQIKKLNRLKSQIDATVVKCAQLPDSLPKIDWAHYKANAADPKAVEAIEKVYSSLKIEPPKAPASRLNELAEAKQLDEARFEKFSEISKSFVESARKLRFKFEKMIPVPEMTREDLVRTFPYWTVTPDNPSVAPHEGRSPGLTRAEAALFEQPDPLTLSSKQAWKDWEVRKKKFYS